MISALLSAMVGVLVVVAGLIVVVLVLLCRLLADTDTKRNSRHGRTDDLRRHDTMLKERR